MKSHTKIGSDIGSGVLTIIGYKQTPKLGFAAKRKNSFVKISHFFALCSLAKNTKIFAKFYFNLLGEKMRNRKYENFTKQCENDAKISEKNDTKK